jgi:PAS domain S-box-containing protein
VSARPRDYDRYHAFIKNSSEGIWRVELDEPIPTHLAPEQQIKLMYERAYMAEANDAMAEMYGVAKPEDLVGLRLGNLLIEDDPRNVAYLTAFIESGYKLSGVDSHEVDSNGKEKYFRNSLVGIVEDGAIKLAWGTQQDVTDQHSAEIALKRSEARLALALKASHLGMWEWDIATNELIWSPELKELFGLSPDDEITYDKYVSMVHPKDRDYVQSIVQRAMETGEDYRMEHRIIQPDGKVSWMLGQGRAFIDNGKPIRMIGTSLNIDELKRNQELQATNAMLKSQQLQLLALNNSKDEFISLASHQLRTPASGVKQYIGMLLEGYAGDLTNGQAQFLKIAYECNERQLHIIDDLLKVAHVDSGQLRLTRKSTDLMSLVQAVIDEQMRAFEARKQQIQFEAASKEVLADIDSRRIRMVIENLIDNAGKYTPVGKKIHVTVERQADRAYIRVTDEGVGIAKKDLSKLFQKFSRIDNELSTVVGGTGIGLYWAKKIIDLHDGTITVQSQPNKGTTFTISLPR